MAGALLQWLRDEMGLIDDVADTCEIARSVESTEGVYIVPAFTGLGAPYWDAEARGTVVGLTRGSTRAHFVRAALESLAYQVHDLVVAMEADSGVKLSELNVDGGASKTTSSCSSNAICFARRFIVRKTRRPLPSAPRIWLVWRRAFGRAPTSCAGCARPMMFTSRRWTTRAMPSFWKGGGARWSIRRRSSKFTT